MRISPSWMTLSVCLAILAQALPTHAQTYDQTNTQRSDLKISERDSISSAPIAESSPPVKIVTALKPIQTSEVLVLREIQPVLHQPIALQIRGLAQDSVQQLVQTAIAAQISPQPEPKQIQPKIQPKIQVQIQVQAQKQPQKVAANPVGSPATAPTAINKTSLNPSRLIQLKEMRLAAYKPVTLVAKEPDPDMSIDPNPEKNWFQSRSNPPQTLNPTISDPATKQTVNSPTAVASVSIEKATSPILPISPNKTDGQKNPKLALGLDPIAPLTVPTTPSQIKIDRTQAIKLEEALTLVTQNNRDINLARIAVDKARSALKEAEAARLPTVNAQGTYTFNDSASARLSNISTTPTIFGTNVSPTISQPVNGTIGVNYNIYTSGLVDANIRTAENQVRIAEADLNRISQIVRLNIATAYYTLQNNDATVTIRQKSVENNQRSLQDTVALEKAGVGTKFDVLQSQVQLSNAQQSLLDAQANQLVSRRDLARQLVYPPTLDLTAADKIEPAQDWKMSLEETILLAYKNRSELDIQKLQREIARDRARASLARVGPQVGLFANLDLADNFNQAGGVALGYRAGVNFSISLFDGGVSNAQVEQFKADRASAEVRFDQAGDQARFDVEQAYINIQSRRTQITTTVQAVEQSNEALRLARLRLSAGVGTQLEVIRAEEDQTRAEVNRLQAIIGFNQSLANLQRAINGL